MNQIEIATLSENLGMTLKFEKVLFTSVKTQTVMRCIIGGASSLPWCRTDRKWILCTFVYFLTINIEPTSV